VRLLLDTHIWIWALALPDRLGKRVARAVTDEANELWLSPISIWELSVLVGRGRVTLDDDLEAWVQRAMAHTPVREAPFTQDVALELNRIRFSHRDPADQFIAASARVFDLTLVTADPRLVALKAQGIAVLANR
jgi:PIN domain nuclease of toxin-antitoxin system